HGFDRSSLLIQEPQEVQQVVGVRPHRQRREPAGTQMRQEPVRHHHIRPGAVEAIPLFGLNHSQIQRGLQPDLIQYSPSPPPSPAFPLSSPPSPSSRAG